MQAIKGSGSARFAVYDNTDTLVNEWRPFGNMTSLNVEPSADLVEVTSTDDADYGTVTDSESEPGKVKITLATNRFSAETLALIYSALVALDTSTGGTVSTAESYTAKMGVAFQVGGASPRRGLTTVVVKDSTATTTYVKDTDYTLDAEFGFITPIGSTITSGEVLKVTYTYAAGSGYKLDVNSAPSLHISFFWKGVNRFDGKRYMMEVPKCTLKASKGIDLMGKDVATVDFELTPILVVGKTASATVRLAV